MGKQTGIDNDRKDIFILFVVPPKYLEQQLQNFCYSYLNKFLQQDVLCIY
jgi:hypothetical protein